MTWETLSKGLSSMCRHDLEKMNSRISSTMESKIEVDKGTCAKPERRQVIMASRWLCETLWVQTGTYYWDLSWQRRCCKNSESQNGKWRAEPASCEVSVIILQWYFRDGKQVRPCWRHFKSSKSHQKSENNWKKNFRICQNSKMVKTEDFYNLGLKLCTTPPPPAFGRESLSNPKLWHTVKVSSKLLMDPTNVIASDPYLWLLAPIFCQIAVFWFFVIYC